MTSPAIVERCIFCKIATGADPSATIMFQNERICIFKDIRPAADHHLLAVPKHHVASVRALTTADRPLRRFPRLVTGCRENLRYFFCNFKWRKCVPSWRT
uniref:Histidine triad nucleotide-binding protein 3 n=1 Tax=Culex pipiens TaxID=7175 RepID=A0A8D8BX69_CULPI